MINKVAHLADIHIRKSANRHDEYKKIFNTVYTNLSKQKPDRIVIEGDLYHDFLDLSGEAQLLMASFLNNLSRIAKVIIQVGNHDIMKKNLNRINVVDSLTKLINNPNVVYYQNSDFYEDDNVVWVVWHHRDRVIKNPWTDIPHTKKKDKIYIDLFHDPIDGCLDQNGKLMRGNYESVNSFKGDFVMAGDLHYYQVFGKNNNMAYPSSLIQQNFGETPDKHGYILWDIKAKTHDFIEIHNEHTYINFELPENTNYDKLKLESPHIKSEPEIKVKWTDLSSNVNKNNEIKIRQYIKERYGLEKIQIERKPIYTNITDIKFVNEGIDINNIDTQRTIFKEYLEQNKYSSEFISNVLELDDIVNSRLVISDLDKNIEWKIEKFWFDNFKSYGDGNIIDWDRINGVIQIHGENQKGKTTILDAICYILHGETLSTTKQEKHGDGRYINNKRTLDECSGGALVNINGDRFILFRKSVRTWNRSKTEVSGVKTTLDFYKGTEMIEENLLNEETLKTTKPIIEAALGNFKDFIRIVLTNADNLNDLLSMNRSVFMDAVIRDAGYDIFEYKLEEYKKYIKELNEERISINVLDETDKFNNKKEELKLLNDKYNNIISEIEAKRVEEQEQRLIKDNLLLTLNSVDEELTMLDVSTLQTNIENNKLKLIENKTSIDVISKENELLPLVEAFDNDVFKQKKDTLQDKSTIISNLRVEVTELNGDIKSLEQDITQTDDKINNILSTKIAALKTSNITISNQVENSKKDVLQLIKDHLNTLKEEAQENKVEIDKIKAKQDVIKEKTNEYKDTIAEIESSNVCVTCGKPLELDDMGHIKESILGLKEKIKVLHDEFVALNLEKEPYQKKQDAILAKTSKIQNKNFEDEPTLKASYDKTLLSVKTNQKLIADNESKIVLLEANDYSTFPDILESVKNINETKKKSELSLVDKKALRDVKMKEGVELLSVVEKLKSEVLLLETDKTNFDTRNSNNSKKAMLTLESDNIDLRISSDELTIKRIEDQSDKVAANVLIQDNINSTQEKIDKILLEIESLTKDKEAVNKDIALKTLEIETIMETIDKFKEQQRVDEIRKVYMQSIHRDGLPTYLLKKSIHIINQEMGNLLSNVNFTIFFDDDFTLKLSNNNRLDVCQNVVESSGKERTFAAIALKVALRKINRKSKPDFIMFDEVMGKLVANSVDEFIEFLEVVSKEVGKLIIIEHVHQINYDAIIEVSKDINDVSSLQII